jgi:hypothetical protein
MFEWFVFAIAWLAIWLVIFAAKPSLRHQMLWVSAFTMLTGLTEPIFVPSYWNPPSLFNLAATTRFDLESFIFSFAVGGIGSVLYEALTNVKQHKMAVGEFNERRWLHFASIISTPLVFTLLVLFTGLIPIYSAGIALLVGSVAAVACRPDLAKNTLVGGILYMGLYFVFFLCINLAFPTFVNSWNLAALSGVVIVGVPLEELMFAFTFGMLWSGIYEHIKHYAFSTPKQRQNAMQTAERTMPF